MGLFEKRPERSRWLSRAFLACLTLLIPSDARADVTTKVPDCGYLNARGCSPFDNEAWNIYFGFYTACDFGLVLNSKGRCVDSTRITLEGPSPWVVWALGEQRDNIGKHAPLNFVTTFGTHNSYSSYSSGFQSSLTTDQKLSLYDQLEAGSRYVRIDPVYYYNNLRVCHGPKVACELTAPVIGYIEQAAISLIPFVGPYAALYGTKELILSPGRLYAYSIRELADWMEKHPHEFIILDFNNYSGWPEDDNRYPTDKRAELLIEPIVQFIGRDKILKPEDVRQLLIQSGTSFPTNYDTVYTAPFPSLASIKAQGKRLMLLSVPDISEPGDTRLTRLTFRRSSTPEQIEGQPGKKKTYISGASVSESYFSQCQNTGGGPLHDALAHKFAQAGEDRSMSVALSGGNPGYLNAAEVRTAVNCGYSIIGVDFLLGQEWSVPPPTGQQPDRGVDRRREAAIWSFEEGDTGLSGPAFMKSSGRWASTPFQTMKPFACVNSSLLSTWAWPRNLLNATGATAGIIAITSGTGSWDQGTSSCRREFGSNFDFYAPSTVGENQVVHNRLQTAQLTNPAFATSGVWLNYKTATARLLSANTKNVLFGVDVPDGTDTDKQVTIYGLPNTVLTYALFPAAQGGDIFLQDPGPVTIGANGMTTITFRLKPGVGSRNAGLYTNRFLLTDPARALNEILINVTLSARGAASIVLTAPGCSSACTVSEGQPLTLTTLLNRTAPSINPFVGKVEVREQVLYENQQAVDPGAVALSVNALTAQQPVTSQPDVGTFTFTRGIVTTPVTLGPGTHKLAAYFTGGLVDSPGFSNELAVTVRPFLAPSPAALNLQYEGGGSIPGTAATIAVTNPSNRTLTVVLDCGPTPSACWLAGSGSGTSVKLTYTSALSTLPPGAYNATARISDGLHATVDIPVRLRVVGKLILSQTVYNLVGANQSVNQLVAGTINGVTVPMRAQVRQGASWLSATPSLVANPAGLAIGLYTGNVEFASDFALAPVEATVSFRVVPPVTVGTNPPGLPYFVDGVQYSEARTFAWDRETRHQIRVDSLVGALGSSFFFNSWTDGGASTHEVIAPAAPANFVANMIEGFPVTTMVTPLSGGMLTLQPLPTQGLYRKGTSVRITATPASGFGFTGFQGDLTGTVNAQDLVVNGAKALVAGFATLGPEMYAIAGATDKTQTPVRMTIQLVNRGRGAAVGAKITSITNVRVLIGSGTVTPVVQAVELGLISPQATASGAISFNWPATATRIQFTVNFADSGSYRGSTTMAVFR